MECSRRYFLLRADGTDSLLCNSLPPFAETGISCVLSKPLVAGMAVTG